MARKGEKSTPKPEIRWAAVRVAAQAAFDLQRAEVDEEKSGAEEAWLLTEICKLVEKFEELKIEGPRQARIAQQAESLADFYRAARDEGFPEPSRPTQDCAEESPFAHSEYNTSQYIPPKPSRKLFQEESGPSEVAALSVAEAEGIGHRTVNTYRAKLKKGEISPFGFKEAYQYYHRSKESYYAVVLREVLNLDDEFAADLAKLADKVRELKIRNTGHRGVKLEPPSQG